MFSKKSGFARVVNVPKKKRKTLATPSGFFRVPHVFPVAVLSSVSATTRERNQNAVAGVHDEKRAHAKSCKIRCSRYTIQDSKIKNGLTDGLTPIFHLALQSSSVI